jgi:hypothetical protein
MPPPLHPSSFERERKKERAKNEKVASLSREVVCSRRDLKEKMLNVCGM